MKVLLINPPPYYHLEKSRLLEPTPIETYTMPLGLGYIAAFLEREGYKVDILDAYVKKYSYVKIEELIKEQSPDVIGITCMSDQRASWFKLIQLIRSIDKKIKIVLGGPHPTLLPEQVLLNFQPDAIVIGEGEMTMLELVRAWENGVDLANVNGIAYMVDNNIKINPPRERIKELDRLPFPAYHMVDLDDYRDWAFIQMLSKILGLQQTPKYATICTSRGCYGNCGYCSSPLVWQRIWTQKSAKRVVDEMEALNSKYGVKLIIIVDDIFTINQKRVISICNEILSRKLKILWGFETSVNFVSYELLDSAKKSGCCCVLYGVESGSKTVLSNISKNIKEENVVNAFNMTKEAGIVTGAFLMVGNPGENEKSINETINLLKKIKPDIILPQIAMITPCTKIFKIAKEKGFIDDSFWLTDLPFPYYTCERKLKTLLRWYKKLYYYEHSKFGIFLRTVRDYIELNSGIRISRRGLSKVKKPS